jgi:EVE domain-containing protein
MDGRRYWIGVVAKDHVDRATAGGFVQVNHGKAGPLERMRAGDGFAYYSPRESHPGGTPLQAFTAIGRVRSGTLYQGEGNPDDRPFRIDVDFLDAAAAPVKPLIPDLTFIRSKTHWGAAFRFGFVRVPASDFARIATAMGRSFESDFPVPS